MNESPENFDNLLKLLALKKYEQPPPGYYDRLSNEVMVRLKVEAAEGRSRWFDFADDGLWTKRIWGLLEARPALAGFFGVAIASLLLGGITYSLKLTEPPTVADIGSPNHTKMVFAAPVDPLPSPGQVGSAFLVSSTNPIVVDPLGPAGLFDGARLRGQNPSVPVSLNIGGN